MNRPDLTSLYQSIADRTGWTYDEIDRMTRSQFWDYLAGASASKGASRRQERREWGY